MNHSHEELESLLLDWDSSELDEAGIERLREILKRDPAACAHYVQQQMLTAALGLEDDAGLSTAHTTDSTTGGVSPSAVPRDDSSRRWLPSWFPAVAAVLLVLLAGRLLFVEATRQHQQPIAAGNVPRAAVDAFPATAEAEPTSTGIALVTRLVNVRWDDDQLPVEVGDALVPGRFAIESGLVQVDFFCGASVILEGPAELDLQSSMLARVHRGRLRAQVPPAARGFSLDVADMTVVDLGTEFGLSVTPEGTDVQVFDGEVEVHRPATTKQLLTSGQAISRAVDGQVVSGQSSPTEFVDLATLESREAEQNQTRFERWKTWSAELQQDPRLIAYYTFDQSGSAGRKLVNSVMPSNPDLDGAIVGARRTEGRWQQKHALEFKRPGDRVRVQIPGQYGSLTFACWVKIDSLDRSFNSLFLTDHYDGGEPHWQILDTGQMYFSVRPLDAQQSKVVDKKVLSAPFWEPSMSGKWIHLATTFDIETGLTTHYLNGKALHREVVPAEQLVTHTQIGMASIGNWDLPTLPDARFAIRNLNGSIDEFAMFAAALSAEEIKTMYQQGKP